MHSPINLFLWFEAITSARVRAEALKLTVWESPTGPNPLFFTVEAPRSHLCIEMDTAGIVTALAYLDHSYSAACHIAHINVAALLSIIDCIAAKGSP